MNFALVFDGGTRLSSVFSFFGVAKNEKNAHQSASFARGEIMSTHM